MKKILALVLVVCAFGVAVSGCAKAEEGGGESTTAGATAGTEETK